MDTLTVTPNDSITIDIKKFIPLLVDAGDDYICRAILSDQTGHGVVLPATINQQTETTNFILPEQLCIFSPNITYILKIELILENQLLLLYVNEARIALLDDSSPENDLDEPTPDLETDGTEEPLNGLADDDEMDDLEQVLEVVAPIPINEHKQVKIEDLVKGLDGEFVKQALWQKKQVPITVPMSREMKPEPVVLLELSPEKNAFKLRMKSLLRGMLV